jgi:hypothetical protein
MAYMSFASCKLALLPKVRKRPVNTNTCVTHAYPWGVPKLLF